MISPANHHPPRLVYLVTEDWYFLMHRLPMARAARAAGYEVHVVTRLDRGRAAIEAEGFVAHHADLARGSRRPDRFLAALGAVRAHYRAIRPDIVHHVALQCMVLGSIAGWRAKVPAVNGVTGLGTLFTSGNGLVPQLVRQVLPFLVNRGNAVVTVENPDDARLLRQLGITNERIVLIPGSGVDTERLLPLPEPEGLGTSVGSEAVVTPVTPVTFAYVGRMLDDKGVRTLFAAHRMLQRQGNPPRLLLAGTPDPRNSTSLAEEELVIFAREPGVTWLGHVEDIRTVWAQAHVAVLASRREGLPVSLLEAAACGRPMIATDVPGCREVALPDENALLVPPDDPAALAAAMQRLASDADLRRKLAAGSRPLVEARFSSRRVGSEIVALYARLLAAVRTGQPVGT